MHRASISLVMALLLSAAPPRTPAQEAAGTGDQAVTERRAHPYSIDLLPDDPAPPPFEAAPDASVGAPSGQGDPFGPKVVTGDLFDRWLSTKDSGITFGGRVTQFGFGLAGGIDRPVPPPLGQGDVFKYTGRSEYDAVFDLEKFGGLPHGRLLVRAEQWYGEYGNVSLHAGTFTPTVFPALLPPRPNDPGVPYITNFLFTQPLSPSSKSGVGPRPNSIGRRDLPAQLPFQPAAPGRCHGWLFISSDSPSGVQECLPGVVPSDLLGLSGVSLDQFTQGLAGDGAQSLPGRGGNEQRITERAFGQPMGDRTNDQLAQTFSPHPRPRGPTRTQSGRMEDDRSSRRLFRDATRRRPSFG